MLVLSEEHYRLARTILARTVSLPNWSPQDQEDMLQEAYLGLVQAAKSYDSNQASFPTYATYRVRGAIQDWLRKAHPMAKSYRSSRHPDPPMMCEFLPEIFLSPPVDPDQRIYISQLLAPLTPRQRGVLRAWAMGYRMWEIGEALGLSQTRISQIIQEAREISGNGHKGET